MSMWVVQYTDSQGHKTYYRGRHDWCVKLERAKFFVRKSDAEYRANEYSVGTRKVLEIEVSVKLKEETL